MEWNFFTVVEAYMMIFSEQGETNEGTNIFQELE